MFDITAGEFLLISVVVLLVVGPRRLADASRGIGRLLGQMRRETSRLKAGIRQEIDAAAGPGREAVIGVAEQAAAAHKTGNEAFAPATDLGTGIAGDLGEFGRTVDEVRRYLGPSRRRPGRRPLP